MRALTIVVFLALMSGCARLEAARPSVDVHMRNVDLHVADDITLHIRELRGKFVASGQIADLDRKQSYTVAVESGEVALDIASLNAVMTRTLGNGHSNLGRLRLEFDADGTLRQKGVIDSAINIPFASKSKLSTTSDGRLRVSTTSVKGFGVPIKPVLSLFRVELDDLLKVDAGRGVVVSDNDLILNPAELLPAPAMKGRLSAVRVENGMLVQVFGTGEAKPMAQRPLSRNHIYWRGGQLEFGKLTMTETDLELVDVDPDDPFDFSVDDWDAQLVAGYSKTLANKGLQAFVPDYNDLQRGRVNRQARR